MENPFEGRKEDHDEWRVSRENRPLSLSYAWPHPSFFWYDTDFLEFESFDFMDHISWITGQNVQKLQILLFFTSYIARIFKVCFLVMRV